MGAWNTVVDRSRLFVLLVALALLAGVLAWAPSASAITDVELFACGLHGPFGMDFDAAGDLYVANEGDGGGGASISRISTTGEVSFFATGLLGPSGVEFDGSGVLYVSDDTNSVFEVSATGTLTPFLTGIGLLNPNAIGFDADDGGLYVAHGGAVEKFDTAGNSVMTSADPFNTNQSIAVDDANDVVYTSDFDGNLYAVDQTTGATSTILSAVGFTEGGLTMGPDGFLYYSAWDAGEVLKIDPSNWSVTTFVDGLTTPRGLRFDDAGNLYITSYETGTIFRSSPAGGTAPPFSTVTGSLTSEWVSGNGWTADTSVTIDIDGGTHVFPGVPLDGGGNFFFNTGVDLVAGTSIVVTGDTTGASKDVTLAALSFDGLAVDSDLAFGTATPGAEVEVGVGNEFGGAGMTVTADGSGYWEADFSTMGFDITLGMGGGAQVYDASCDSTFADSPPLPSFLVRPPNAFNPDPLNHVHAFGWPDGATVTLTVDDPANGPGVDYTDSALGNPDFMEFNVPPEDLVFAPGQLVTVTDGSITKTHVVTGLMITDIDLDADTVTGVGTANSEITLIANGMARQQAVDPSGSWFADFTAPGPYGEPPTDLWLDSFIEAKEYDEDGDETSITTNLEPQACSVPRNGLVAWWQAEGDAVDSVGTFDGTLNGAGFGPGVFGDAFEFDGIDDRVATSSDPALEPGTGDFSFAAWVRVDSISGTDRLLWKDNGMGGSSHAGWFLMFNGDKFRFGIGDGSVNSAAEAPEPPDLGVWYHVVGVRGGGSISLYLNGQLVDSGPDVTGDASHSSVFSIGGRLGTSEFLDGAMDDVAIWNRALTPEEIAAMSGGCLGAPPFFEAALDENWVATIGFEPDSMVTFEIYDGPGGNLLWGPEARPTDGGGHYFLEGFEHGVDLVPGTHVVVYDGSTTKQLTLEPVTIDVVDPDSNVVAGTAPVGRSAFLEVGNDFDGAGLEIIADGTGDWSVDLLAEAGLDVTGDMRAQLNLSEDPATGGDGDATVAVGYPPPPATIQASLPNDWIATFGFAPGATLTFSIFDGPGGTLLYEADHGPVDGSGFFFLEGPGHGLDLVPGRFVSVTDGEKTKELELEDVTANPPDLGADTVAGTAPPNRELTIQVGDEFGGADLFVLSDMTTGDWLADFDGLFDITASSGVQALLFDDDGDATVGEPPPPPIVIGTIQGIPRVSLGGTWEPSLPVEIRVWASEAAWLAGDLPDDSFLLDPPDSGGVSEVVYPLGAGMVLEADNGEVVKTLVLADLTLHVDLGADTVSGIAPDGDTVGVSVHELIDGEEYPGQFYREVTATGGIYSTDFSADFDLREFTGSDGEHVDGDGDITHVEDVFGLANGIVMAPDGPVAGAEVRLDPLGWTTCTDGAGRFEFEDPVSAHLPITVETGPSLTSLCGNGLFYSGSGDPLLGEAWADQLTGAGDVIRIHDGPQSGPPMVSPTGDLTFVDNDGLTGLITREFGSWLADDIVEGDWLFVSGTTANDGFYEVLRLTGFGDDTVLVGYRDGGPFDGGTAAATVDVERVFRLFPYLRFEVEPFSLGAIEGTHDPVVTGTELEFTAPFNNPYPVMALWEWGDGTTSPGLVEYDGSSWWAVDGHLYSDPGVYTATLTLTDEFGRSLDSTFEYSVVYDPSSGFVTGGGWILVDGAEHKFGFNAKYDKQTDAPKGNLNSQLYDMHLASDSIDWLVITLEDEAIYGGIATLDGSPGYMFRVDACDGDRGLCTGDSFRLRVWAPGGDPATDAPVFDIADMLGGGKIQIHR